MSTETARETVRILSPGRGQRGRVFVTVKWDGTRLSLTGVEGPKRNGDCQGSCGQCVDSLEGLTLDPDWTQDLVESLRNIWKRWHLNDMRAGCEHQRAEWNTSEKVEVVTYRLNTETIREQRRIKENAIDSLKFGRTAVISEEEQDILALPFETKTAPDTDSEGSGRYKVEKRETKTVGWLRPEEHPRGILSKPCPECGYKYGTSWKVETVPDSVIAELMAMPETERTHPWGA